MGIMLANLCHPYNILSTTDRDATNHNYKFVNSNKQPQATKLVTFFVPILLAYVLVYLGAQMYCGKCSVTC